MRKPKKKTRGPGPGPEARSLRNWGFAAGAAALLAVLTLLLCVMGGVFDFAPAGGAEATPAALATPETRPLVTPASPPPAASETPEPVARVYTISAVAGRGGSVSPAGVVEVAQGADAVFTITPDEGYELAELKIDGQAVDPVLRYAFTDVSTNHSLYAVFRALPAETPTPSPGPAPTEPASPTDLG